MKVLILISVMCLRLMLSDKIIEIDSSLNQIIITTTKEGPIDNLRIRILYSDLFVARETLFLDLAGPLLMISRGRYTINFLRSDRWYGVTLHSVNVIDGIEQVHVDERLVKTHSTHSSSLDIGVQVTKQRKGIEEGYRLADILMNAQWTNAMSRNNLSEAVVKIRILCDGSMLEESFVLDKNHFNRTIVLQLETLYEISWNESTQLLTANMTPKYCHSSNSIGSNDNSSLISANSRIAHLVFQPDPVHLTDFNRPTEPGLAAEIPAHDAVKIPDELSPPPSVWLARDSLFSGHTIAVQLNLACSLDDTDMTTTTTATATAIYEYTDYNYNDENATEEEYIWLSDSQPNITLRQIDLHEIICDETRRCADSNSNEIITLNNNNNNNNTAVNKSMLCNKKLICYKVKFLIENDLYEVDNGQPYCESITQHYALNRASALWFDVECVTLMMLRFLRYHIQPHYGEFKAEDVHHFYKYKTVIFKTTARHGFPQNVCSVAHDPVSGIMAIGTRNGEIRIFGAENVEWSCTVPGGCIGVSHMYFVIGYGALLVLCADLSFHKFELSSDSIKRTTACHEERLKRITSCEMLTLNDKSDSRLLVGTVTGNVFALHVNSLELSEVILFEENILQSVASLSDMASRSVDLIVIDSNDTTKLLILFNSVCVVYYDTIKCEVLRVWSHQQPVTFISWTVNENEFVCSHVDGSFDVWCLNSEQPVEPSTILFGPYPCTPITKILCACTISDSRNEMVKLFCGGMPRASYGDRYTLTAMRSSNRVIVLDFASSVVDFFIIPSVCSSTEGRRQGNLIWDGMDGNCLMGWQADGN
ncbi:unnamed protein product [Anisakis simplex]|uniref:Lethal(2) giant larvae protein (inferred by orthology to a D. melanogaster protein) n=1 Tax=Anisakis simplex TaxID=6269 RepID=A0A0M3IZ11_ANISI|nr:unnamed protein product [Anisakis simplex]